MFLLLLSSVGVFAQDPADTKGTSVVSTLQKVFTVTKEEEGRGTNPLWAFVLVTIVVTAIATIVQAIRRDRILRRHNGKYGVLLHGDDRYTGIIKLILQDVEIASEKTDVQGKDSGRLFTKAEFEKMKALIRYHDELTEKEAEERRVFVEKIANPTFVGKVFRRLQSIGRQFNETVKTIYDEAIGNRLRSRLESLRGGEQLTALAEAEIEEVTGVSPTGGASYRLLIDRLIGTRVIARINGQDYECILADYTKDYYQLLDVEFKESWTLNAHRDMGKWVGHDKGLRIRLDGDVYTIESRVPYPIILRHVRYRDGNRVHGVPVGNQDRNWVNLTIEPYGTVRWEAQFHHTHEERDVAGGLLQEARYPVRLHPQHFRTVEMVFETTRKADVTIRYSDNVIQYRAEKFDARLVTLDSLTEVLWRTSSRFVLTDDDGKPIRGLHLNRGYITNLSKDRVDIGEVASHYAKRFESERQFQKLDARFRPIRPAFRFRLGPLVYKARLAIAQIAMIQYFREEKRAIPPSQRILYFPFVRPRREWTQPPPPQKMPIRVGVLTGRPFDEEYRRLRDLKTVLDHRVLFRRLPLDRMDRLAKVDILWVGYGANLRGPTALSRKSEVEILRFVAGGGIVVALAPNTRSTRGNKLAWVPDPLVLGKGRPKDETIDPTNDGERLFREPREIPRASLVPKVWWTDWSDRYTPLATITETGHGEDRPSVAGVLLPYGDGLYILLGVGPETVDDLEWSVPLAENLLHYVIAWKDRQQKEEFVA